MNDFVGFYAEATTKKLSFNYDKIVQVYYLDYTPLVQLPS